MQNIFTRKKNEKARTRIFFAPQTFRSFLSRKSVKTWETLCQLIYCCLPECEEIWMPLSVTLFLRLGRNHIILLPISSVTRSWIFYALHEAQIKLLNWMIFLRNARNWVTHMWRSSGSGAAVWSGRSKLFDLISHPSILNNSGHRFTMESFRSHPSNSDAWSSKTLHWVAVIKMTSKLIFHALPPSLQAKFKSAVIVHEAFN